jgi:hypothetical protein
MGKNNAHIGFYPTGYFLIILYGCIVALWLLSGLHKIVGAFHSLIILGFCFVGIPVLLYLYSEKKKSKEKVEMRDIEEKILKKQYKKSKKK